MSRRIVPPVDRNALQQATNDFNQLYPNGLPRPGTRNYREMREKWLDLYVQHGGAVDDGATFQAALPHDVVEPCPLKNKIERVDFVHQGRFPWNREDVLTQDGVQHVNLPRESRFVDGERVTSIDRLGRGLRVRVKFQRAKAEQFKVALLAHSQNVTYTNEEQLRREAFKCPRSPAAQEHVQGSFDHYQDDPAVYTGTTRKDGTAVVDGAFKVPGSGGDKYTLVAWDVNGNVVFSQFTLKTTRTMYGVIFQGTDQAQARVDMNQLRTTVKNTYAQHYVDIVWLGDRQLPNLTYHDIKAPQVTLRAVRAKAKELSAVARSEPYVLKFVFVDHCARAFLKQLEDTKFLGVSGGQTVQIPLYNQPLHKRQTDPNFDWRKCLWKGFGRSRDSEGHTSTGHEWFDSAELIIHAQNAQTVPLAVDDFTLVPLSQQSPDAFVEVRLTLPQNVPPNTDVTVRIKASIVMQSVLGESFKGADRDIVAQPARHNFDSVPHPKQISSVIHEVGHALGMVATAQNQGLSHPLWYSASGNHCHHGIDVALEFDDHPKYHQLPYKDTGTCVMYGQIPAPGPNMNFCPECTAVLRKLDLGGGFSG